MFSAINSKHFFTCLLGIIFFCSTNVTYAQKYVTRTAHVKVKSTNRITDVEADNYQVASTLNKATGAIEFIGLLKSFEFKLGAADQLFNSKLINVSAHPSIKFTGKVENIENINFSKPGTYPTSVKGTLYIWDEKRLTTATGTLTVNEDGSVDVASDFVMMIEESSVAKVNQLMKEKLPDAISINTETLGISRKVAIALNMTYKAR